MMRNNVKIAITGGVCSGKSTVAKIIEEQGHSVISCDEIYHELLNDERFANALVNEFGDIKNSDGSIDKAKLSKIVFGDDVKREKLNALTHPKIMQRVIEEASGDGIFFCEVPLLFEGGFERLFDNAIVVLRKKDARLKELMNRANIDKIQALLRINSQYNYEIYSFAKYYVINNSGNLANLRSETLTTLERVVKDYS